MLGYAVIGVVVVSVLALLASSIHVLKQYERAVQFRLGKLRDVAPRPRAGADLPADRPDQEACHCGS